MIDRDYASAFELLSEKSRNGFSIQRLQNLIVQMHPRNWPKSITATEFEPLPGHRAMNIYLFGREGSEEFAYKFEMEGEVETGYTVSSISRLQTPFPPSPTRRSLPIRRSTS
jgi:hypothetical protein